MPLNKKPSSHYRMKAETPFFILSTVWFVLIQNNLQQDQCFVL